MGELEEVLGSRIGIRSGVDQHRRTTTRRKWYCDRGAKDPRKSPKLEQTCGQHRSGVAGRDHSVRFPFADGTARCDERALGLCPNRLSRLLVHRDCVGGDDLRKSPRVEVVRAVQDRLGGAGRSRPERAVHDRLGAPIAAKGIDGHSDGH